MPTGTPTGDISGKQFGHLTAIEKTKSQVNIHRNVWKCKCVCGRIVTRRADYLINRNGKNASCGCKHPMRTQFGSQSKSWKGYKEIGKQYLASIKCRCKHDNRKCDITLEDMWEIYQKQEGLCALTKLPLTLSKSSKRPGTASLDRKDSTQGYTIDNIWWVHKDVNRMKNAYPIERFIEICKLVTENQI